MFYGGRLAAHLTNDEQKAAIDDLISLRPLNRRGVIVIDSDRDKAGKSLNSTKSRLVKEFNQGPGFAWITKGREIENYVPESQLRKAIASACPTLKRLGKFGPYDNTLKVTGRKSPVSKVDVARYIVSNCPPDLTVLDLKRTLDKLRKFVIESNPKQSA
jgi:hypothetical protein